jgi:hypothetical protein
MNTSSTTTELTRQITQLIRETAARGDLLKALHELATHNEFSNLAHVWAPALYQRDAVFFEAFLVRHLDWQHGAVIKQLLPQIEADRRDSLFQGLYPKVVDEKQWNDELQRLTTSTANDDEVLTALKLRTFRGMWFGLKEETALALYQRNPDHFSEVIAERLRRGWWGRQATFSRLRARASERGDSRLTLALFRTFATSEEWNAELRHLLSQQLSASALVSALRERHPVTTWSLDCSALAEIIAQYGAAIWPYIDENLTWVNNKQGKQLLDGARRSQDEAFFWRLFFRVGDNNQWNGEMHALLQRPLDDQQLEQQLLIRMPSENAWRRWQLRPDLAEKLYQRLPNVTRGMFELYVEFDQKLLTMAEQAGDAELLDVLNYKALNQLARLVNMLRWQPKETKHQKQIASLSKVVIARFQRLYRESPESYVRHAANILSFYNAFEIWNYNLNRQHNPAFAYIINEHRADWLASPAAMRELLESPNIFVQLIGLEMLQAGGEHAAQRVGENLSYFRALLRGRARIQTKKRALECLQQAAQQGSSYASTVLPLLADAMDIHGKRSVSEKAMVQFVRLRRAQRELGVEV